MKAATETHLSEGSKKLVLVLLEENERIGYAEVVTCVGNHCFIPVLELYVIFRYIYISK